MKSCWVWLKPRHGEKTMGWELLAEAHKQALIEHTLLRRTGNIKDVVKAVLYIIKDAPYMTGSVLRLDGGYVLGCEKVPPMLLMIAPTLRQSIFP